MKGDDEVLRQVLRNDQVAWMTLFSRFGPMVTAIARTSRAMGSYRNSEDDVRNVMAQVFERLRRDDYRALRTYVPWHNKNPSKTFSDWLTIVTVNVVRSYMSAKLGAPREDKASAKQLVNTFAEGLNLDGDEPIVLPHMTTKETAQRIIAYAQDHLADDQLAVLAGWLEGSSFAEMAAELHLADAKGAERLLRAALARLRRQFAEQT
jgi:hypothetical protein